jgi:hypothetical protein
MKKGIKTALVISVAALAVTAASPALAASFGLPDIPCPGNLCAPIPVDANPVAAYIARFYQIAIAVAGVLAVGIIMAGSLFYTFSGGSTDRQREGKEMIVSAFWGIALLFGSYLILNTINPELITLDLRQREMVKTTSAEFITGNRDSCSIYAITGIPCDIPSQVKSKYDDDIGKCKAEAAKELVKKLNECVEKYESTGGGGYAFSSAVKSPAVCHPYYKIYSKSTKMEYLPEKDDSIYKDSAGWKKGEWKFC